MKNLIKRAVRNLRRWGQPSPKTLAMIEADLAIECIETPALTVEQIILNMRKDGLSYRQIQAKTGASYHKVRKVCLSA
jgi:uncharacterized protein YerC